MTRSSVVNQKSIPSQNLENCIQGVAAKKQSRLETLWLRKIYTVNRMYSKSCTQGRWGMGTSCYLRCRKKSDLSGINSTCTIYLDQCDAGIPERESRKAHTVIFDSMLRERHLSIIFLILKNHTQERMYSIRKLLVRT